MESAARARRTRHSLVHNLNLFMDTDGLVRSAGRVNIPCFRTMLKNAILAHKASYITSLMIRDARHQSGHMGLNYTVNLVRQTGWWIPRLRQAVFSVLKDCFVCKRLNAKHFKPSDPPALPSAWVNFSRPFAVASVDFTGHFFVLDSFGNWQTIYLLIFTVFSSKAIHLETLSSMAVDDFL